MEKRIKSRHLFGAGIFFFMGAIVLPNPAIIGFALVLLVAALVYKKRESKSSDR